VGDVVLEVPEVRAAAHEVQRQRRRTVDGAVARVGAVVAVVLMVYGEKSIMSPSIGRTFVYLGWIGLAVGKLAESVLPDT
jgi:hypothetical protein